MSVLNKGSNNNDLDFPLSPKVNSKLIGHMNRHMNNDLVALTASGVTATGISSFLCIADRSGSIGDLYAVCQNIPAAGEFMVYDVQKAAAAPSGGTATYTSILTAGGFTLSAANYVQDQISLYAAIAPSAQSFAPGDTYVVLRSYTAGATPSPLGANKIVIEMSDRRWQGA
jgi:hypothetical protein